MSLENDSWKICVAIFHSSNTINILNQQSEIEPALARKADHLCSTLVPNGKGYYYGLAAVLPNTSKEGAHLYGVSNVLPLTIHYSWTVGEKPTIAESLELLENCLQLQHS